MSYVGQPYEHDVFVSYAHGVAEDDIAPLKHWSQRLIVELKASIRNTAPDFRDLDVFIDLDLDPTRQLTPYLKDKVKKSAILLIVMSPFYLDSDWCRDEAEWFEEQIRNRGRNDGLFFVARALPTERKDWPVYLKDERGHTLPGFLFHPEPATDGTRAFGWYHPHVGESEHWPFYKQLYSLSGATISRLKEIRRQHELLQSQRAPAARATPSALYLHARPEHAEAWEKAKRSLEDYGFKVKPDAPVKPVSTDRSVDEARRARLKAAKDCDALLILRPESGSWIEHEIATTGHNERMEIEALFDKRLPCAIIDRVGGDVPMAERFGIDIVSATGPGWLMTLQGWLMDAPYAQADVTEPA
jgi:hypothetical protein